MDALRALQLLTDLAYLALGIAAVAAAVRSHERARLDVAILFGALAITVALQETLLLSCAAGTCLNPPFSSQLSTILVLILPFALLRLLDDVADTPRWQMWLALVLLIGLAVSVALSATSTPPWRP